jgi:hypothetical protein
MLDPVIGLPAGVVGLRANGTVIAQDVSQALVLARAAPDADKSVGLILFVDPDLDGYLSEIVSELGKESQAEPTVLQRWALVVPDDVLSEAEKYRVADKLRIFSQSHSNDALAWVGQAMKHSEEAKS